MMALRGIFRNGVVQFEEGVDYVEGGEVIVTFLEAAAHPDRDIPSAGSDSLLELADECAVETGISDLAQEHDHYLYGTPKRDAP